MSAAPELERVRKALRDALPELERSYGVATLAVFGSIAREDARAGSDVDILVRFVGDPPGLFGFVRLERHLASLLGRSVDLVMESAIKPRLREKILSEAIPA